MAEPPAVPNTQLSSLLSFVSRAHPKLFFKPLFTCAASSKDLTIANQLCILSVITRFMPDFWIRDAEMLSVALMSEPVSSKTASQGGTSIRTTRLGQMVLLVELIEQLRSVRAAKDLSMVNDQATD